MGRKSGITAKGMISAEPSLSGSAAGSHLPSVLSATHEPHRRSPRGQSRSNHNRLSAEGIQKLNLPQEVTLKEAAQVLGCDAQTVMKFIRSGLLEFRDAGSPFNLRPTYRIKLESVVELRTTYRRQSDITSPRQKQQRRTATPSTTRLRHIRLG